MTVVTKNRMNKQRSLYEEIHNQELAQLPQIEESEMEFEDTQRQLIMPDVTPQEVVQSADAESLTPSGRTQMRKAHTQVDIDSKLKMLFPPLQVIPEEKVFHISGEKEVIDDSFNEMAV